MIGRWIVPLLFLIFCPRRGGPVGACRVIWWNQLEHFFAENRYERGIRCITPTLKLVISQMVPVSG